MEASTKAAYFNTGSLVCGTWFLLTGWFWVYYINLIIALPIGILGAYLWKKGKDTLPGAMLNRIAGILLVAGVVSSIAGLLILFVFN